MFGNLTIEGSGYLLQGATISLLNGITTTYASGTSRVHAQIHLADLFETFTVASGGTLHITTGVSAGLSGTLTLTGGGNYRIDGAVALVSDVVMIGTGTIYGTGSLGRVNFNSGTLSAGDLSDPTLTFDTLTTGAVTVQLDLLSPTVAQQIHTNGPVSVAGATLSIGITTPPAAGTQFRLIDNDSLHPVGGTFAGLPEGATFTAGGQPFSITYVGGDGNDVVITAVAADLSVTKSANTTTPTIGQNVTFTITVSNAGPSAATNVVATDTLPAGLTYVSATADQGSCAGTSPIICNLGTLNSGASAHLTIVATASSIGPITNSASATANEVDPTQSNNADSATITVGAAPTTETIPTLDPKMLALLAIVLVAIGAIALRH